MPRWEYTFSAQWANLPYALIERPFRQLFTFQSGITLGRVGIDMLSLHIHIRTEGDWTMQGFFSTLLYSRTLRQLGSIACAALFLAACSSGGGDGGGGTPPAAAPSVGRFVDSPVQGLHYTTSSGLSGITDANGQYNYRTGDTVIFDIGGVPINTVGVSADPVVTALSVFGATTTADQQVVNLSRLLLTLGCPLGNCPVIQLPATLPPLPSAINFNVPSATFAANIAAVTGAPALVSVQIATDHLAANFFTVSVTLAGSGSGSVASTPSGISCGATCSYVFSTATQITLTPTGAGFTVWSAGTGSATVCNGIPGACTFTPTSNSNITATFNIPPPSTLTISNAGTGTGSVNCNINSGGFGPCAGPYADGNSIILQATATSGSTFTGWTNGLGNATVCPNSPANCSFTLNTNTTVTANFVLNAVTQFSVTANPPTTGNGGGGTVLCNAGPCGSYPVNTVISVIPTPNSASLFSGWSNGTGSVNPNCSNAAGACTFTLTANTSITANFNRPTLNVIVGGAGAGAGTVTSSPTGITNCTTNCTASFDKGTAITLTASGGGFSGWSGGGCSGTGTCPVTLDVSKIVTATFGAVSAAPTFKFIGAPGRQLLAINPVSPGTPIPVKVGGVDVILGNPPTAAGTTLAAGAGASVILSASYNSATTTVTNIQPATLLFISGGKVYKASPLVSDGVPGSLAANEPQQVSNVTNAVSCGSGAIHDVVNLNQAVGFNSAGSNGICNDGDDQIVIMHVNDSSGTAPVTLPVGAAGGDTTVYSLTTGFALHAILVTAAGDLQWMDNNTFVLTAITNGTGIGPVTVIAEQSDKVFLGTPTNLYIYRPSTHTLTVTPVVTADPSTVFVNWDDNPADLNNIFLVQSDGAVYKVPLSTTPGTTITTKHFVALAGTVVANTKLSNGKVIIATGINPSGQFGVLNPCYTATPRSCNNGIIAVDKVTGASTTIEAAALQKAIFLNRSFNNYVSYTRNDPATAGISDGALLRIEDASNSAVLVGQFGGWAGEVEPTSVSLVSLTFPTIKQVFSQFTALGPPALGTVSVISSPTGAPVSLGAVTASPSVTNLPFFHHSRETTMIGQAFLQASPGNFQLFFIDTALGNSLTPIATPGAPAQWVEIRD
jgi:hypothetical protein